MSEGCTSGEIGGSSYGYDGVLTQTHKPEAKSLLLAQAIRAPCVVLDPDAALPGIPLVSEIKFSDSKGDVVEITLDSVTHPLKRLVKVSTCSSHDRFCNRNGGSYENDCDGR